MQQLIKTSSEISSSDKVKNWNGPNKDFCRRYKIAEVARFKRLKKIPGNPRVLSFAGAKAHFELGLVKRGLVSADNIITIQDCNKRSEHDIGEDTLRELIPLRNELLPGMLIFPEEMSLFADNYKGEYSSIPAYQEGNPPRWHKELLFREEMLRFQNLEVKPFDILDLDFCGIFSSISAGSISKLFANGLLSKSGLLFINHQKGRDGKQGRLFAFLRNYFEGCPYFKPNNFLLSDGSRLEIDSYYDIRHRLVPIYYACQAFTYGYFLEEPLLIEYRDRPTEQSCPSMLQWYFSFRQRPSFFPGARGEWFDKQIRVAELSRLNHTLKTFANETYKFLEKID